MSAETMNGRGETTGADGWSLRALLLLLVHLGILGLLAELVLLEHTESFQQWIPLASLLAGLVAGLAVAAKPSPGSLKLFRVVMAVFIVAGLLGLWFHLRGNLEFELERNSSLAGVDLLWESLRGATPALAPGALSQLGLLGLAYTHRHPALAAPRPSPSRA
jgi:hypothetical protein